MSVHETVRAALVASMGLVAPMPVFPDLDEPPEPWSGPFSYICTFCDVKGATAAGEVRKCWCCQSDHALVQR